MLLPMSIPSAAAPDSKIQSDEQKFVIETRSCFSQCGQGPNVGVVLVGESAGSSFSNSDSTIGETYLNGLSDVVSVATQLELLSIAIPSKLIAAVNVLERAQLGTFFVLVRVVAALAVDRLCVRVRAYILVVFWGNAKVGKRERSVRLHSLESPVTVPSIS